MPEVQINIKNRFTLTKQSLYLVRRSELIAIRTCSD